MITLRWINLSRFRAGLMFLVIEDNDGMEKSTVSSTIVEDDVQFCWINHDPEIQEHSVK